MKEREVSAEFALECFRYNPDLGWLFWRHRPDSHFPSKEAAKRFNARCAGEMAGSVGVDGAGKPYMKVGLGGCQYMVHRIIFLMVEGRWPEGTVDHINGDSTDNRWRNLRDVPQQVNSKNRKRYARNTSGHTGVAYHKASRKWAATIFHNGKNVHLGVFDDKAGAVKARETASRDYGYHENHGKQ